MTRFTITFSALAAFSGLFASAAPALADRAAADPSLPKEIQDMYCLVGNWRGKVDAVMGADKFKLEVSMDCQATSGGHGISCKSRFVGLPTGDYEETDLFGWDAGGGKYHWFSVTNGGETHDHVADKPSSPTIKWVYRGLMEGQPFTEKVDMTFNKDSTKIAIATSGTLGDTTLFSMKGSVRKAK